MRGMNFEHIETRRLGPRRRLAPAFYNLRDFASGEGARRRIGVIGGFGAGGDQFPVVPILDFGRWLQRRAAFPWAEPPRLAPAMAKLDVCG